MQTINNSRLTIDVDTGGTFTDGTISDGNSVTSVKVLTTPHDLTVCFKNLIGVIAQRLDLTEVDLLKRVESLRYSTTIGTNTIIERDGPQIGLIVLEQDLLLFEGLDSESLLGSILHPFEAKVRAIGKEELNKEEILQAVEYLLANGAERLVVSISEDSESLERAVKQIIFSEYPRHILGALPILFSSELTKDTDVFRKTVTSLLNAYLHPSLEHFLYNAEDILRDHRYPKPLFIFGNDGTTNRVAKVTALKTYNSGPAGGVEGATQLAKHYGLANVVTVDIGGTSTDVSFIVDGKAEEESFGSVEAVNISFPLRSIHALGGGGGTIARVSDGAFKLGPESAGAAPGPACFGFGGTAATVTDANVVLGYFEAGSSFAGQVIIDGDRAAKAIDKNLAAPLGTGTLEAALQVRDTLEQRIGSFISEEIAKRGKQPEDFVLMAFGGAGPVHACNIAGFAGIEKVVVPGQCSVFSSYGIGFSDVVHKYESIETYHGPDQIRAVIEGMRSRAVIDMKGEGFSQADVRLCWELEVVDGGEPVSCQDLEELGRFFAVIEGRNSQQVKVRVALTASGNLPHVTLKEQLKDTGEAAPGSSREVFWADNGQVTTPVYSIDSLQDARVNIDGPAILEGESTTIVVPMQWNLAYDQYNQFILSKGD